MQISESYIQLFEHHGHSGAQLTIPLQKGSIARINERNLLYNQVSSFFVSGPANVWVRLHAEWPDHDAFNRYASWQATVGAINQDALDRVGLRDTVRAVSWHVGPSPTPAHDAHAGWSPPTAPDVVGHQWTTGTEDEPNIFLPDPPNIPDDEAWCVRYTVQVFRGEPIMRTQTIRARDEAEAHSIAMAERDRMHYNGYSLSHGRCRF